MAQVDLPTPAEQGQRGAFREVSLLAGDFVQFDTRQTERISVQASALGGSLLVEVSLFSDPATTAWYTLSDNGTDPVELNDIASIEDVAFAQVKITAVGGNADFALLLQ